MNRPCNPRIRGIFLLLSAMLSFSLLQARNYFSAQTDFLYWNSTPFCVSHPDHSDAVPQFEMVEYGFELPAQVEDRFLNPNGLNPFDPVQLNIVAEFSNGTHRDTVFGFYYEDFVRDQFTIKAVFENCPEAKWIAQPTEYKWRVRFAIRDTGKWEVKIKVMVNDTRVVWYTLDDVSFRVVESDRAGFLELSSDLLHFRGSGNGKTFFMLGQDMAWPDGSRFRGGKYLSYPNLAVGGFLDVQDWTKNLAENGGNTIRVVNVPWSYELEWDTIGIYNLARAWELDQLFRTCESNQVKIVFCLEHGIYSIPAQNEEYLDWRKHPYNRFLNEIDYVDDFLRDSVARKYYKNKLRYFLARWGCSSSLGVLQLSSEIDYWEYQGGRLQRNRKAQDLQWEWHSTMLKFAKEQVKYRTLLTSTSYGSPPRDFKINTFSSPYVDVVCPRHCYYTERNDNLRRFEEVNRVGLFEPGIHKMFPTKPAIIDEMGFGSLGADPNDIDANNDANFHNSLWATSFSGLAGAGLYWWRWGSNEYRQQNFPALRTYFSAIDMNGLNHPGHWEDANRPSKVSIETFYACSDDKSRCAGWVHNASYWWGNISQKAVDRSGKSMTINSKTGDDKSIEAPKELPDEKVFEIHDLAANTKYKLIWYSTRGAGGVIATEEIKTNLFGTAKIEWKQGAADWAYVLVKN
jgi:hypothetical protein